MKRRVSLLVAVVAVVAIGVAMWPARTTDRVAPVPVLVTRGPAVERLVCRGEFMPRGGVLVAVPFSGRLQFIVDDGSWVEAGAQLFAIAEDDAVRIAAESRSQLLAERQELRLARLRREATSDAQARAVAKAERTLAQERLRWRIETTPPEGGEALIRLDRELMPLEERTLAARASADQAAARWQRAQDAYLEALDARSTQRDALLRLQARIDELAAAAGRDPTGLQTDELAARERARTDLVAAQAERETLAAASVTLVNQVRAARTARDQLTPERDAAVALLTTAEAAEEDLRVRIEIEKKHLSATQLALDLESARLAANQAKLEGERAEVAFTAGAISQAKLEESREAAIRSAGQVAILEARLTIARRPPADEVLAELTARIGRAEVRAGAARADRDRAIAIADQEIALSNAKVERLVYEVESRSAAFPEVLAAGLAFLDQELTALDPDDEADVERLAEARAERAALAARLEEIGDRAANVIYAPVAGVVRLQRQDNRPKQAGDEVWEEDMLVEIYPPGNLAVRIKVNEVDIAKLSVGMPAAVSVPAIPDFAARGQIRRLSALGRDKLEGTGRTSGVVVFDGEVTVDGNASGLRQGMTALVEVEVGRRDDALQVPLAAVHGSPGAWTVRRRSGGSVIDHPVTGQPLGDLLFLIESGLAEGDEILLESR